MLWFIVFPQDTEEKFTNATTAAPWKVFLMAEPQSNTDNSCTIDFNLHLATLMIQRRTTTVAINCICNKKNIKLYHKNEHHCLVRILTKGLVNHDFHCPRKHLATVPLKVAGFYSHCSTYSHNAAGVFIIMSAKYKQRDRYSVRQRERAEDKARRTTPTQFFYTHFYCTSLSLKCEKSTGNVA